MRNWRLIFYQHGHIEDDHPDSFVLEMNLIPSAMLDGKIEGDGQLDLNCYFLSCVFRSVCLFSFYYYFINDEF